MCRLCCDEMAIQVLPDSLVQLIPNSLTLFFTVTCITLLTLGTALFRRYQFARRCDRIPGPPSQIPFLGVGITDLIVPPEKFLSLIENLFRLWAEKSILRLWAGPVAVVLLSSAESAEVVLSSNKIIDKSSLYDYLHPWLATGLLTSTGSKWHQRRKMLTPAFHFKILEDFVAVFNEQSSILIDKLNKNVKKEFDVFPLITLCTLDVICETAMGRHVNAQNESDSDYVKAVYAMTHVVQLRQMRPWLQPDWLFRLLPEGTVQKNSLEILHGFTDKVIHERKSEMKLRKSEQQQKVHQEKEDSDFISKKPRLAFLDLLIEASQDGTVLSDLDIREEVDTFMFEGHDTTAAAISWSLFLIGNNPKAQAQVHDELDRVFGGSERPVTMADLSELKYLECCIKEALRLYPSVPFFARQLTEDVNIVGHDVPAGATLNVFTYLLHRDPKYFPDPESYQPERFFPENIHGRHPYAYVPFSAGPRNCIGQKFALMEEKVILASVLRCFQIESVDKPSDLDLLSDLILRPNNGIRLRITRRM